MSSTKELYEINEREGIIANKRLARVFILELDPWTSLVEQLSRTFGSGAGAILFDIGKSYGLSATIKLGKF